MPRPSRHAPARRLARLAAALLAVAPAAAAGATVAVEVSEVESAEGDVLVAICTEETFLGRDCPHVAVVPARAGETRALVEDVPPGVYAIQVVHDANENLDLDRGFLGWPKEGLGFSRDAPLRMGPPSFEDARVEIDGEDAAFRLRMRYY